MRNFGLKNKKILVTGSSGFLGRHIMKALEEEGAIPIGADKSKAEFKVNLAKNNSIVKLFFNVCKEYDYIDGLINNAAVSYKGAMQHITRDTFDETLQVNTSGTASCIYEFSRHCTLGNIVNVASIYGLQSPDFRIYQGDRKEYNSAAYGASKAGVIQLTKYYAAEFGMKGKAIRVNSVSPGGIYQDHNPEFDMLYSDKVPLGRMANPEEIVNSILFLLSPLSSYITGHNLVVDGGLSVW